MKFQLYLNIPDGLSNEAMAAMVADALANVSKRVTENPAGLPWFQTIFRVGDDEVVDVGRFAVKPDGYR